MTKNEKINVRGVEFDNVTMDEAVSYAWEYIESDSPVGAVFTPNAEIVQMCVENNENYELINSAALVLPDGSGVVKAAKILGTPLKEKVALNSARRSSVPHTSTVQEYFSLAVSRE